MAARKRDGPSGGKHSLFLERHSKPASMRRVASSRHVAGHHRIYMPKADMTCKNMPTDIFTVRTENAPTSAIRKSQFSEAHVTRADTASGSAVAVAIPSYPSIQSGVLSRPGVSAAGVPRNSQINRSPPNGARRGQACWSVPMSSREGGRNYFSELLIEVNLSLRFVPRPLTTAIMASAMPAAIRPYSIAVAPDSSDKKFNKARFNSAS